MITRVVASISMVSAIAAFALGSAPFTPAVLLVLPATAGAIFIACRGMWRTALMIAYVAVGALLVSPMLFKWHAIDVMLIGLGGGGILLLSALRWNRYTARRSL